MLKSITLLSTFIFISLGNFAQERTKVPAYPCLWINKTQIEQIKKDTKDSTLKMLGWLALKNAANKYLKEPLEIPHQGGNWEQYYISPITNNVLKRGKLIGDYKWEHIDPITKQVFQGDENDIEKNYDGVVIGFIHNTWALGLVELGITYQMTNDTAYFNKAKQILMGYAALYPLLEERTRTSKRLGPQGFGKIHVQDLNEAQWLVNITEGADLIWDNLTNEEKSIVKNQLLLPALEVVNKRSPDISNIQCWRNTATGMVGFLLQDSKLIQLAMEDTTGFTAQIKKGFNADGFTNDLSPNYQFFSLHPLCLLAQVALNNNYKVDIEPMHKMFTTPIAMSNPQLMLPPFNDSRPVKIDEEAYLYEWAYSKFKDSTFGEVLFTSKRNYFTIESGYKLVAWNLLFGDPNIVKPIQHKSKTKIFDSSGVVVLTKGNDTASLSCYLKYTNQTKNLRHFHNAQLDFSIIKGSEYVAVIPGNLNYATTLSDGWYRSSVAHNTLVFNERQQRRASARLLDFGYTNGVDFAVTNSTNIYVHDATFVRSVALFDENTVLVVDQFRAAQPQPATFDIFYHQAGVFENLTEGLSWVPPDAIGYKYLMNTTQVLQKRNFSFSTKLVNNRIVKTTIVSSVPTSFITGYGKPFMKKNVPVVIYRAKTEETEVVTIAYIISVNGRSVNIELEPNTNADKRSFLATLQLEFESGKKSKVVINPYKETIVINGVSNKKSFEIY